MDRLDSRVYYGLKDALRKVVKNISEEELPWGEFPLILIDFWSWEVFYFENESDAIEHIEKNNVEWDDSPPDGEDEELIILKYCTQEFKDNYPSLYEDYVFFKEINEEKYYRQRSFVSFEPELIINVSV